jgi:hypothetical protein
MLLCGSRAEQAWIIPRGRFLKLRYLNFASFGARKERRDINTGASD